MNELSMVFVQGFTFVGKLEKTLAIKTCDTLKESVKLDTVNLMRPEGLMPITILNKIGDIDLPSEYISVKVDTKSSLFKDYVKLTTGIEIPAGTTISH